MVDWTGRDKGEVPVQLRSVTCDVPTFRY